MRALWLVIWVGGGCVSPMMAEHGADVYLFGATVCGPIHSTFGDSKVVIVAAPGTDREDWGLANPAKQGLVAWVEIPSLRVMGRVSSEEPEDGFGESMTVCGDWDGDGHEDLAVGAPWRDSREPGTSGAVVILSGSSGEIVTTILAPADARGFGYSLGKVFAGAGTSPRETEKGVTQGVVVGTWREPALHEEERGSVWLVMRGERTPSKVFRGMEVRDGFGESVCGVGDVDGDGMGDIAVGSMSAHGIAGRSVGQVEVLSIGTGRRLWTRSGARDHQYLGARIELAPDVDGDGFADIVVWGDGGRVGEKVTPGSVGVLSLVTGRPLWEATLPDSRPARRGSSAFSIGHGRSQRVLGVLGRGYCGASESDNSGVVVALDLKDGAIAWVKYGEGAEDSLGSAVANVGDNDGDGVDDFLCGAPGGLGAEKLGSGKVLLLSGANGTEMGSLSFTMMRDVTGPPGKDLGGHDECVGRKVRAQ